MTLSVDENEPVELQCPVTPVPDLSIQWSKNNEDLDPMWTSSNVMIKRLTLRIQRVQASDAGMYKCNVVNGFGSVQVQFRLNVHCECWRFLVHRTKRIFSCGSQWNDVEQRQRA